jgi:hypothetical protein
MGDAGRALWKEMRREQSVPAIEKKNMTDSKREADASQDASIALKPPRVTKITRIKTITTLRKKLGLLDIGL